MANPGVYVRAYNKAGRLAAEYFYTVSDWYENLHPLIDDEATVRVKYQVQRIEGEQLDSTGIMMRWRAYYGENGLVVSAQEWRREDGIEEKWRDVPLSYV